MRRLEKVNRIEIAIRPITDRVDFSCIPAPKFDNKATLNPDTQDNDWKWYRYRRK